MSRGRRLALIAVVTTSILILLGGRAAESASPTVDDTAARDAAAAGRDVAAAAADARGSSSSSTSLIINDNNQNPDGIDQGATLAAATAAIAALARADTTGAVRASLLRALDAGGERGALAPAPATARSLLAAEPQAKTPTTTATTTATEPWRPPKYHLHTRALSEFLGTMFVIFIGESALANELLPSTKGHAMGWFAVVWTFGFAFFFCLQAFGGVSAKLNPAMCLGQWVAGIITGVDFLCLSLAEVAGAFCGGALVWVMYLPHFKSLPEPPSLAPEDELLRRRDVMQQNALQIASYNTRPEREVGWGGRGGGGVGGAGAGDTAAASMAAEKQAAAAAAAQNGGKGAGEAGCGAAASAARPPPPRLLTGARSLSAGGGGGGGAPGAPGATPATPGRAAAAAGAIMGALDNFVYYLRPGVMAPRLEDELAAVDRGGRGGWDRDPWRDEEAAAFGGERRRGGPGAGVVAVSAHELAGRYYQHDDQMERRRREHAREAAGSLSNSRAQSTSALGGDSGTLASAAADDAPPPPALPPLPRPRDLRRRTVQVADMQRHLADLHVAEVRRRVELARGGTIPARPPLPPPRSAEQQHGDGGDDNTAAADKNSAPDTAAKTTGFSLLPRLGGGGVRPSSSSGALDNNNNNKAAADTGNDNNKAAADNSGGNIGRPRSHPHLQALLQAAPNLHVHVDPAPNRPPLDPQREAYARECEAAWALLSEEERRACRLYEAALKADQNAKLSIFATRPALYSPLWNLIAEAMGTFMLILGALLIELVPDLFLPPELRPLYVRGLQAFLIGLMVVVFISSLGGPTGYAANPARDFGPRLAHFLLPICNKGASEWRSYGWVPVVGPLVGGAAAGAAYHGLRALFMYQM